MNDDLIHDLSDIGPPLDSTYKARICRCINSCENGEYNSTCVLKPNAKCFRKLEIINGVEDERAGCLMSTDIHIDQCNKAADPDFLKPTDLQCCWDSDLCNDHLQMRIPLRHPDDQDNDATNTVTMIVAIVLFLIVGISIITIVCVRYRFKLKERKKKRKLDEESDVYGMRSKNLQDLVAEYSTPCSSGSGMPLLVQRTIARQIEILRELGRGRYGTVKLGKWRDEYVAVKMFNSTEEKSWARETEIYQSVNLRHENILCFVASDINGTGGWTELYLITDYHANGSLHDYLQTRPLDVASALSMAHSISKGLAYLHTEIIGTQGKENNMGKQAIAHRDIKSKNILVKQDGTCCIADMGLAVIFSSSKNDGKGVLDKGHYKQSSKQGTKRYMPPEVLNGSIPEDSFDAYKAADVYSFALVLWEILNCTTVKDWNGEYRVPYYDVVGNDPDFDEMRKVVDIDNIRPEISQEHSEHPILSRYVEMMMECWVGRPESRLTMLRARKTLCNLRHDPLEDPSSLTIPEYQKAGYACSSDRSNSSGFPNDYYHSELEGKDFKTRPGNFYQGTGGYSYDPRVQNGNCRLNSNGYSDGY